MECLNNLIGITADNCQCLTANLTQEEIAELKVSKSGLYLDEVEGGLFLRNVVQLDKCKSFIQIQKDAIKNGQQFLIAELVKGLAVKYKTKKNQYFGTLGRMNYTTNLAISKRLQYLKVEPVQETDGVVTLKAINLYLNQNEPTNVWIVEMFEGDTIGTTIWEQTVENRVALDIKLPLKKNGRLVNYFVVWEKVGAVLPRDTKASCNCPNGNGFENYIYLKGGEADDFSALNNSNSDGYTHGIVLEVEIRCETGNLFCKEYDESDAVAVVMAWALRYKSAELVIENVINSGEVNRYTLLSNTHLWGKRSHFKKEFEDRIAYLLDVIDVTSSDCFICRDDKIKVGNILA